MYAAVVVASLPWLFVKAALADSLGYVRGLGPAVAAAWELQADPWSRFRNGSGLGIASVPSSGSGWRRRFYCSRYDMGCQLMSYNRLGFRSGGGIASVSSGGGGWRCPSSLFRGSVCGLLASCT